ncbi:MAG: MerR family transcriptional regulator [Candidatus Omnitrophota bacterium]
MKAYIDNVELGKIIGVSNRMVDYYRKKGVIQPSFKVGKHYRYDPEEAINKLKQTGIDK